MGSLLHYSTIRTYNKPIIGSLRRNFMKGKPKHLSLRIDEDLLRKFEYVAKYDDRSMNWYLLHLIKNEIADFEEKHGEIPTASDSKTE